MPMIVDDKGNGRPTPIIFPAPASIAQQAVIDHLIIPTVCRHPLATTARTNNGCGSPSR
jgi:hypothetical protein